MSLPRIILLTQPLFMKDIDTTDNFRALYEKHIFALVILWADDKNDGFNGTVIKYKIYYIV